MEAGLSFRLQELVQGKMLAEAAALAALDDLWRRGMITDRTHESFRHDLSESRAMLQQKLSLMGGQNRRFEQQQQRLVHRRLIDIKKSRLLELSQQGLISDTAFRELSRQFDEDLIDPKTEKPS